MYDTRAVRQALRCLGEEPAPVPVDDDRRVVLAGGGNEIAMSLYRAMGRGARELSEPQMRERQLEMLAQFEREAAQVLSMLGAFRTVISLEDERAARRGLPEPVAEEVRMVATGTGTMHHAALGAQAVPVRPGATYVLRSAVEFSEQVLSMQYRGPVAGPSVVADGADLGAEEGAAGRREGSSASQAAVDGRVQRFRRERVAPDMETCDDCKGTVAWIPGASQFVHTDSDLPAYSKDGHIIHMERLQQITDAERLRLHEQYPIPLLSDERKREIAAEKAPGWMDPPVARQLADGHVVPVQQGPAMDMEEEAQTIVRRAMEAAKREITAERARTAHHDRDSGIEPGFIDTSDSEVLDALPYPAQPRLARVRNRVAKLRRWFDGYTADELD